VARPPLHLLAAYRLFGWRLGPSYRTWTYDDISRRGYPVRQTVPTAVAVGLLLAVVFGVTGADPRLAVALLVCALAPTLLLRDAARDKALRQQGLGADGEPGAGWYADDVQRRRRNLTGTVVSSVLVTAAIVLLAVR
jgi:hypothetical protein